MEAEVSLLIVDTRRRGAYRKDAVVECRQMLVRFYLTLSGVFAFDTVCWKCVESLFLIVQVLLVMQDGSRQIPRLITSTPYSLDYAPSRRTDPLNG